MNPAKILVVDDDPGVLLWLVESLGELGYAAEGVCSPLDALARAWEGSYDLVIADVEMPELRGVDLVGRLHAERPELLVLLITAFGSIELAVQAIRVGACDFVTKPFPIEALVQAIERALRERRMKREIVRLRRAAEEARPGGLVARSPAMQRVLDLATRAAGSDANVLLCGESGVGKGTIAAYIHRSSARAKGAFLQVNCGAIPAQLVESELFGVRRGAFTDAKVDREGLFAQADGGTLFLDEIGELPLESQPKLLHVIEQREVRPLGSSAPRPVNVRIIAATNQPIEGMLREKKLRPDLYFRLDVIRIDIPPLRERRDDIEPLVDSLLARLAPREQSRVVGLSAAAMRALLAHDWPGNVRELENVITRALALADHDTLLPEDLTLERSFPTGEDELTDLARRGVTLDELQQRYVDRMLEVTGGNKAMAARLLGIDRRTLYRKVDGS